MNSNPYCTLSAETLSGRFGALCVVTSQVLRTSGTLTIPSGETPRERFVWQFTGRLQLGRFGDRFQGDPLGALCVEIYGWPITQAR